MIKIAYILITFNSEKFINYWFESIRNTAEKLGHDYQIFVIDNGSFDNSYWILKEEMSGNLDNCIFTHLNNGVNRAHNWIVKEKILQTNCTHIAMVNHDAIVDKKWATEIAKGISDDNKSIASSKILDVSNKSLISSLGHLIRPENGKVYDVGYNKPGKESISLSTQILCPCFAASVFPVSVYKEVGFPDNDQWMYYDDIEFFTRCLMKGYRTIYIDSAIAYHPLPRISINPSIMQSQEIGRKKFKDKIFPPNGSTDLSLLELQKQIYAKWELYEDCK